MGHYAFIIAAGFIVIGSVISFGMRSDTRDAEVSSAQLLYKEEAREAAFTGLNLTLRRVVLDFEDWSVNGPSYSIASEGSPNSYKRSEFWTTVTPSGPDTLDIESIGRKFFLDGTGAHVDTTHTIDVRIIRTEMGGGLPAAAEYAIVSDEDMFIRGTLNVRSIDGSNANIHANGELRTRGTPLIEGYGSATTELDVKNPDDIFQPPNDENGGDPNAMIDDSVHIPTIDVEGLRTEAQTRGVYFDTDTELSGDIVGHSSFADWAAALGYSSEVGSTPENPLVVFSEGTISFPGNWGTTEAAIGGYGIFATVGGLHVNSGIQLHGTLSTDSEGHYVTQLAILSTGQVTLNGTADVTASIVANPPDGYPEAAIKINGTATLTGGMIADDIDIGNGTFDLYWAGLNQGFAPWLGGGDPVVGPVIAAWSEF